RAPPVAAEPTGGRGLAPAPASTRIVAPDARTHGHPPGAAPMSRRSLAVVLAVIALASATPSSGQDDPLPSWVDGPAKRAILDFVGRVSDEGGPVFVPVGERLAVFDNDGTLWCEQPVYVQAAFVR